MNHDPYRVALELREQLSSEDRRLAFLFGAGTSMAVGIPGIAKLTAEVEKALTGDHKIAFASVNQVKSLITNPLHCNWARSRIPARRRNSKTIPPS